MELTKTLTKTLTKEQIIAKKKGELVKEYIASMADLNGKGIILCEYLEPHCLKVEITSISDLTNLYKNSITGKCDFYNKCKNRSEGCGCNLKRSRLLSLPDPSSSH